MRQPKEERREGSIAGLFRTMTDEILALLRAETDLLRAEAELRLTSFATATVLLAIGAIFGMAGLMMGFAAIALWLREFLGRLDLALAASAGIALLICVPLFAVAVVKLRAFASGPDRATPEDGRPKRDFGASRNDTTQQEGQP